MRCNQGRGTNRISSETIFFIGAKIGKVVLGIGIEMQDAVYLV